MWRMNREALHIPADGLLEALEQRIERKRELLAQRDHTHGKGRIQIGSYMENIGWPELLGYDMNRFYSDPAFMLEMELRERIFWADNSLDDWLPNLWIGATVGMYYDITMFGQRVWHEPNGVPQFDPHPIAQNPDLSLIPPIDFHTSGNMPRLLGMYEAMRKINQDRYGGRLSIGFPIFGRGPLDVCIQLRTYERFVEDTMERPHFLHEFLDRIVTERARWNHQRRRYLGEPEPAEPTTRIDDDWLNIPFLSPAIFEEFALPAYRKVRELEGNVNGFHTCGRLEPVVRRLLEVFPHITWLDVSGWNDFEWLDRLVDPAVAFGIAFKNSFVLSGTEEQHCTVLRQIARLRRRRHVGVCAQAILKLYPTYEENLARMNRFIERARDTFAQAEA